MRVPRIVLAGAFLSLLSSALMAKAQDNRAQDNPFVQFNVSGIFQNWPNNQPPATVSGWFIVNEDNGKVVRADLFHGNTELPTLTASVDLPPDVFVLGMTNTARDLLSLVFFAPRNDGALAGYKADVLCPGPWCMGVETSFLAYPYSYANNDDLASGNVTRAGRVPLVEIGINAGRERPAFIDPRSHELGTIAIISNRQFDAVTDVDTQSLTFGPTGVEQSITSCEKDGRDVDHDRIPDLICHFNPRLTEFLPSESLGILVGKTVQGSPFVGMERVVVKPVQR